MNTTAGGGALPSPQDQQLTPAAAADNTSSSALDEIVCGFKREDEPTGNITRESDEISTATTLHHNPPRRKKRRESEAADASTTDLSDAQPPHKQRKREASPPWQFPTAENSTLKTADGRRVSARFNAGTPVLSESDSHGRSNSRPASASRPSPPWRKFQADRPTTVHVGGVRKSGRVNKELTDNPKRISPRQKRHVDKFGASPASTQARAKRGPKAVVDSSPGHPSWASRRPSSSTASAWTKVEEQLKTHIADLEPPQSFLEPEQSPEEMTHIRHRRNRSSHDRISHPRPPSSPSSLRNPKATNGPLQPDVTRPPPRIKLRFNSARHIIPPPHPQAAFPPPLCPPRLSLWQIIESHELKEMQQPYSENERGPPSREEFWHRQEKAAEQEGVMRRRLIEAGKTGGPLSKDVCSLYQEEQQPGPSQQYGHPDHLVAHALYFRHLQTRESQQHRQLARKIAYEALDQWKLKRGPTEEDLQAEANKMFGLIARQVVVDVKAKWERVLQHVEQRRKERWEAEEELKRQERLRKQLAWSENMVARQRGEAGSEMEMSDGDDDLEPSGSEDRSADEGGDGSEDSEENMSEEESHDETEEEDEGDVEGEALKAYLAQRDAEPPDRRHDLEDLLVKEHADGDGCSDDDVKHIRDVSDEARAEDGQTPDNTVLEHDDESRPESRLDAVLADPTTTIQTMPGPGEHSAHEGLHHRSRRSHSMSSTAEDEGDAALYSDESTNMDSEDDDSDDDIDDSTDEDSEESDEAESEGSENPASKSGLLALFSKAELRASGLPTPLTSAEGEHVNERDVDNDQQVERKMRGDADEIDSAHPEVRIEEMPNAVATADSPGSRLTQGQVDDFLHPPSRLATPASQALSESSGRHLVPVPALLRGTLRSYQHAGLDWLVSLYRNETNGILADEMGLGKTIQTIALFAHLAEQQQVWESHLVIVPTSVILNWVTEFQKFLPGFRVLGYYGTSEERQAKRRGWINDPHHENREKRGYNVVVTSYNVALKDINAIRNVPWHYMVLDEAHNIRNFNSQRFQVLIRLRTRARLLLTGTPLQNSLTELWSLLTFLTAGDDDPAHGSLEEFLSHWKEPVKEIFDRGVQTLSDEASRVVGQLHTSLRPFMLRRLKADVEKDLPKKTEHTVVCKLSKRQRQLYQEYMGLADTRAKLTQGNAVTAGKVLLSLRRVCNHPDLFDPRPIQTSFALEKSSLDPYSAKEQVVRRLLGSVKFVPEKALIINLKSEGRRRYTTMRSKQLSGVSTIQRQINDLEQSLPQTEPNVSTMSGCQAFQRLQQKRKRLEQLRDAIKFSENAFSGNPIYGTDLRELLTVRSSRASSGCTVTGRLQITTVGSPANSVHHARSEIAFDRHLALATTIQKQAMTIQQCADHMQDTLVRFAFCTPEVTSPVLDFAIPQRVQQVLRAGGAYPNMVDPAHEARIRTSIVFPDSRLLVYDSGKLQRLTGLLRELQAKGSRSLIFTQMTGTLNILEQFLSLLNLPYLRLDGSTPVERRQLYSAEFNRPDSKYQCMILSSRAGGVGLNLTGASSVIFYDLDWNPQMDKQCMDRAHRIGQVRDVEVYKMVSEKTVEENILRRANQKSLLDQTVIQEGRFTTDYQRAPSEDKPQAEDDVAAAIDRFLAGGDKAVTKTIESVEDREDVQAAQQARKEEMQDDDDFAEKPSQGPSVAATPGMVAESDRDEMGADEHVDAYMIRYVEHVLKDVPYVPPVVRKLDKHGRDPGHRPRKKRL